MKMETLRPEPPVFDDVEAERLHIKQRLAAAFRLFSRFGFDEGVAGHITARDPEHRDCFWVNPYAVHFSQIKVSNLSLIDHQGRVVVGQPCNAAAFAIHSRIHMIRPDVTAAAHAHGVYGRSWSTLGRLLDPLTQDACAFYRHHSIYHEYNGIVYDTSEGDRIGHALGRNKAVIMVNHGNLTVGTTVDEAAWWFITMERSCQAQLMAEAAGTPRLIDDRNALLTRDQVGTPYGGWVAFQPLYQKIVREQPDLLD
jgi:ribulose-5-phosphate 4-epimerase/fuculose-1-phosphate aldolase